MKSSTSIKVDWQRPADCRDWNGKITGYSVRYGENDVGEEERSTEVSTIISGLTKETVYTFEVAAETIAGTGVYSELQTIMTPDGEH